MSAPQVELADNERRAANAAMRAIDCGAPGNRPEQALDAAIETINRLRRLGAPVGTIKRSPEGYIAERREDTETGERHWASLTGWRHQGQSLSQSDVDEWQTIYTPGPQLGEMVSLGTFMWTPRVYGVIPEPPKPATWSFSEDKARCTISIVPEVGDPTCLGTYETHGGSLVLVEPAPRAPRVITGRGLHCTERDAEWTDRVGDRWRRVHKGWEVRFLGVWMRLAPAAMHGPYTEVIE